MSELRCPHCTSTTFNKNPFFLECAECGTRYVLSPEGVLQRTEAFGFGEGEQHNANAGPNPSYSQQTGQNPSINYNFNAPMYSSNYWAQTVSPKSRLIALLLCIFLGMFGAHYFYVRRPAMGFLYLFTFGCLGYGWLFGIICIAIGKFKDSDGLQLVNWDV